MPFVTESVPNDETAFLLAVLLDAEEGEERARGATRLDDWADVRWLLTMDNRERRYFAATGRDVSMPEGLLEFDPLARQLKLAASGGNRSAVRDADAERALLEIVKAHHPNGIGSVKLSEAMAQALGSWNKNRTAPTRDRLAAQHKIKIVEMPRGDKLCYLPGPHGITPTLLADNPPERLL